MPEHRILNDGVIPSKGVDTNVAAKLRNDINRLKSEFYDLEKGRVDYESLRQSEAYRQYRADTALLRDFDLGLLKSTEEQLAFWINLYNTLVIHGVIELEIRETVKEDPDFFHKICYRIGEYDFTPDSIEHGILRGNRRPPYGVFHLYSRSDPRLAYVIEPPDPRIHFTLVCASSSCPPINYYAPERILEQLDVAASGFVNGPEVDILPRENRLSLSPIFKWYRADFGGHEGVIDLLIRYMDHGESKDFLLERGMGADVSWKEYDWRLNR